MIMIALVFGNALKEQKHYEDRVATTLFDDIQKITSTKSEDHVIMNGNISYAPSIRQAIRRYRILRSLVSINFRTDRDDGAYIHNKLRYYGLDTPRPCKDVSLNAELAKLAHRTYLGAYPGDSGSPTQRYPKSVCPIYRPIDR
jgi:hypothetical protein